MSSDNREAGNADPGAPRTGNATPAVGIRSREVVDTPREKLFAILPTEAQHQIAAEMRGIGDDDPLWSLGYALALVVYDAHQPALDAVDFASRDLAGACEEIQSQETAAAQRMEAAREAIEHTGDQINREAGETVRCAASDAATAYAGQIDSHIVARIRKLDDRLAANVRREDEKREEIFERLKNEVREEVRITTSNKRMENEDKLDRAAEKIAKRHLGTRSVRAWGLLIGAMSVALSVGAAGGVFTMDRLSEINGPQSSQVAFDRTDCRVLGDNTVICER